MFAGVTALLLKDEDATVAGIASKEAEEVHLLSYSLFICVSDCFFIAYHILNAVSGVYLILFTFKRFTFKLVNAPYSTFLKR